MRYGSNGSGGCYLFIVVVGITISLIWAAGQWLVEEFNGHRAEHAARLTEAHDGILSAQAGVRVVRMHGIIKRLRLEGGKWVYAGENETMGTYVVGITGEGRVDCAKDVRSATEGEGFYRREFSAVFGAGIGKTVVTRQGMLADGPEKESQVEVAIEPKRPPLMGGCDEACGWAYCVYSRWPGSGGEGVQFADMLDGSHAGIVAEADTIRALPAIRIRLATPEGADVYWLDPNNGYAFIRWERREGTAKNEHEVAAWEVKEFMSTKSGFYFPDIVEGERIGADGNPVEKWRADISNIWVNGEKDEAGMYALKVPAGRVVVKVEGKPEKILTGTADENSVAINGGWNPAAAESGATTKESSPQQEK